MKHPFSTTKKFYFCVGWLILGVLFWRFIANTPFFTNVFNNIFVFLVHKPVGMGPARVARWLVVCNAFAIVHYLLLTAILVCAFLQQKGFSANVRLFVFTFLSLTIKDFFVTSSLVKMSYSLSHYFLNILAFPSLLVIALFLLPALLAKKTSKWLLLGLNFVLSLALGCCLSYIRAFDSFPSLLSFAYFGNIEMPLGGSVQTTVPLFSLVKPIDFLLFLDIPVLVGLYWGKNFNQTLPKKVTILAIVWCLVSLLFLYDNKIETTDFDDNWFDTTLKLFYHNNNEKPLVQKQAQQGAWGSFMYSNFNLLQQKTSRLTDNDKEKITLWYKQNQSLQQVSPYDGLFKGKNVIILVIESLESFTLGANLDGVEITPTLNSLLNHSFVFPNIYEQSTASSVHGLLAVQTGLYSPFYGSVTQRFPNNSYRHSLAYFFDQQGYSTLGSHSSTGYIWKMRDLTQQMGYQHLAFSNAELPNPLIESDKSLFGLADRPYYQAIWPFIKDQPKPSFTFLFTSSSHTPFELIPSIAETPFNKSTNKLALSGYLNLIHYADQSLSLLLTHLKESGQLDNTVLVITGDHTGLSKYFPNTYTDLERMVYPPTYPFNYKDKDIRVPLLIYNPSIEGHYFDVIGGQVDIYPTVASLFTVPPWPLVGNNLFTTTQGYALLPNGDIIGQVSPEQASFIKQGRVIADLQLRYNYFP